MTRRQEPPIKVKVGDIRAFVDARRRARGLPERAVPPEGLNEFGRLAWQLRQIGDEIKRQGQLLDALRACERRQG